MRTNRLQDPTTSIHGQRRTGVIALLLGAILIAGCVPTTPAAAVILRLPAPITVNADDAAGAVVTFDVTATTAGGVTLPVTCESVSSTGGRFPIGETTVTCSASNGSVRQVGWFVVTVREWIPPLPVIGAGSTFAAIALEQWRADSRQRLGLDVRYFATGSVNGQIGFSRGDFDFAASGIPVQPSNQPPFNYSYVPIVAGGTALAYNVTDADGREIKNLKLSPETIGKIFTEPGRMFWDDPAIIADNPDLAGRLPRKELVRVAQSGAQERPRPSPTTSTTSRDRPGTHSPVTSRSSSSRAPAGSTSPSSMPASERQRKGTAHRRSSSGNSSAVRMWWRRRLRQRVDSSCSTATSGTWRPAMPFRRTCRSPT